MAPAATYANFTQGNLFRHVSVMSLTASIGLMAIFAVDLLDILFISMLGRDELAAAAGYASVIMFFASAINIGLSIAAGALVARALGRDDAARARDFASSSAVLAVAIGLGLALLALPNMAFLLALTGAEGTVANMAAGYLRIILPATFLSGLSMVAVAVLRAHGDARGAMYPALLGAAVNAVLDPILIFGLGLDLEGAALATVLARLVTMGLAFGLAIHRYRAFARPRAGCVARDFRETASIALPAMLGTVATPVGTAIVTREMARYGADAVAALAVINRLVPVVFSVVLALSGAIGPIIGQNFGAGRMDRVKEAFSDSFRFLALYVVVMSLALFVLRSDLADLFKATGMMRSLLYLYLGPLALASFFNGAVLVANAALTNLGHPEYGTAVNWARHTVGTWPFVIALGAIWGASGVLIGQAVGGAVFAAGAIWLSLRVIDAPCRDPLKMQYACPDQRMQVMVNRACR